MQHRRRWHLALVSAVLFLGGAVLGTPGVAWAAITITNGPVTVRGSDIEFSCDVNPDGGTVAVAGASWVAVGGTGFQETPRVSVSGAAPVRLTFLRDGDPFVTYQGRCKVYPVPGGTLVKGPTWTLTTTGDTRYGAIVGTHNELPDTVENFEQLYEEHLALFDTPRLGVRIFSSSAVPLPGEGLAGDQLAWVAAEHPDEPVTVSFKTFDAGRLTQLLDWVAVHGIRTSLIFFHEPENDCFTLVPPNPAHPSCPQPYKSTYVSMRAIVDAHPAAGLVSVQKNLNWYWQHINAATKGGIWQDYLQPNDPADVVSWDAYSPLNWNRFATPDEFMRYPLAVWQQYGRPWGYGEIGATVDTTRPDRTPQRLAEWVTRMAEAARNPASAGPAYAALPPAQFFKYWCAHGTTTAIYHLDPYPVAVQAYQQFIRTMPLAR